MVAYKHPLASLLHQDIGPVTRSCAVFPLLILNHTGVVIMHNSHIAMNLNCNRLDFLQQNFIIGKIEAHGLACFFLVAGKRVQVEPTAVILMKVAHKSIQVAFGFQVPVGLNILPDLLLLGGPLLRRQLHRCKR